MYKEMDKPKPQDPINQLSRPDPSLIFQLRTQHTQLNWNINRFNPQHPPLCRNCSHPYETVGHVLFECSRLEKSSRQPTSTSKCALWPPHTIISKYLPFHQISSTNECHFLIRVYNSLASVKQQQLFYFIFAN